MNVILLLINFVFNFIFAFMCICHKFYCSFVFFQVWGCGDKTSREVQLDIKKWQIKEAERQRTVKLTAADWMDHPDRFLLELGGRQNYNN